MDNICRIVKDFDRISRKMLQISASLSILTFISVQIFEKVFFMLIILLTTLFHFNASAMEFFTIRDANPSGSVAAVGSITIDFDRDVSALGQLDRALAPASVNCPINGSGQWVDPHTWSYNFDKKLPDGTKCEFVIKANLVSLKGAHYKGQMRFEFTTAAPKLLEINPAVVDVDGYALLVFSTPVREEFLPENAYFAVKNLKSPFPIKIIYDQKIKTEVGKKFYLQKDKLENSVLIKSVKKLPEGQEIIFVIEKGLMSKTGIASSEITRKDLKVMEPFRLKMTCSRVHADASCIPFSGINLESTSSFSVKQARKIVIKTTLDGKETILKPEIAHNLTTDENDEISYVAFKGPFPPLAKLTLEIPENFRDSNSRPLSNQSSFPLQFETDKYPPLAKFASGLGFYESKTTPAVPLTVRDVEADIEVATLNLQGNHSLPRRILNKMKTLTGLNSSLNYKDAVDWIIRADTHNREHSLLEDRHVEVQKIQRADSKKFEVIGVPLSTQGFFILEAKSMILGANLLQKPAPLFVSTVAVNSNLAVHTKYGKNSLQTWVTALDSTEVISEARVTAVNCAGKILGTGRTNSQGLATITVAKSTFQDDCSRKDPYHADKNIYSKFLSGVFIFAEKNSDFTFAHSSFEQGIEPWRFRLESASGDDSDVIYHTVFDRPLYRQQETVSMRHFFRSQIPTGLKNPKVEVTALKIQHDYHSEKIYELKPVVYADSTLSSTWQIPKDAPLGRYRVLFSGKIDNKKYKDLLLITFPVQEFRLPQLKANGKITYRFENAKRILQFHGNLRFMSGVAASNYPLKVSMKLREGGGHFFSSEKAKQFTFNSAPVKVGIQKERQSSASETEIPIAIKATDPLGSYSVEYLTPDKFTGNLDVILTSQFKDPNGEIQISSNRIYIPAANINVGIKKSRNDSGRNIIDVMTVDGFGKPVAGMDVAVDLFQTKTYTHRKKIIGGFYSYEFSSEIFSGQEFCKGRTNQAGLLRCENKTQAINSILGSVNYQARLTGKNISYAVVNDWLYTSEESRGKQEDSDRMDLILSQKSSEPGDVIRIDAVMPYENAMAWVTIESDDVIDQFLVPLTRKKPYFDLEVKRAYVPNAVVSVLAIRGRVGQPAPTAFVDLGPVTK